MTEIRNAFCWLIGRIDTVEKRISMTEDISIESSKIKGQKMKIAKTRTEYTSTMGQLQKIRVWDNQKERNRERKP